MVTNCGMLHNSLVFCLLKEFYVEDQKRKKDLKFGSWKRMKKINKMWYAKKNVKICKEVGYNRKTYPQLPQSKATPIAESDQAKDQVKLP